ncbi:hypothetical protein RND71_005666 [Anisodus tanguticus]|uniref:Uncharacterized protein n=1 Tax=Anisodus tanguticus TaxID=243964 RepID=A0AAE1SSD2_9SOLA|nr:hypothetical protein RND71_005666 [Anisodus tanguticus]
MGDLETLAKARRELEDLYLGVPDDSVNLTFEDLSELRPRTLSSDKKIMSDHIVISKIEKPLPNPALTKFPSIDFSRAFKNTVIEDHHHHINNHNFHHGPQNHVHNVMDENAMLHGHSGHHHATDGHGHSGHHHAMFRGHSGHQHAMDGHGHDGHHHATDGHGT